MNYSIERKRRGSIPPPNSPGGKPLKAIIGVIADVSGSMKATIKGTKVGEQETWSKSIFQLLDNILKHASDDVGVFSTGIGGLSDKDHWQPAPPVFDLLTTIQNRPQAKKEEQQLKMEYEKRVRATMPERYKDDKIRENVRLGMNMLYSAGARYIYDWADVGLIERHLDPYDAAIIAARLEDDPEFRDQCVSCLPERCKTRSTGNRRLDTAANIVYSITWLPGIGKTALTKATDSEVRDYIEKVRNYMKTPIKTQLPPHPLLPCPLAEVIPELSVYGAQRARELVRGCVGEEKLTQSRVDELLKEVEPFIYGGTPMMKSMAQALNTFENFDQQQAKKMLFILSDGLPSDLSYKQFSNPEENCPTIRQLRQQGVIIIGCFIDDNKSAVAEPRRLYSKPDQRWDPAPRFMYDISSTISTEKIPRTIFLQKGWKIDFHNNETKLFAQVNHPQITSEFAKFAREMIFNEDALSDALTTVDLDMLINQEIDGKTKRPEDQGQDKTCYAYAIAVVVYLAMKRILGREGDPPDFYQLKADLIAKHGIRGAHTFQVLEDVCRQERLGCRRCSQFEAMQAIAEKRPVVARFKLTDEEWKTFHEIFDKPAVTYQGKRLLPDRVLTEEQIDVRRRSPNAETYGHAVVLTSYSSEGLRLMNSWGTEWGDGGFFTVKNAEILGMEFYDVYWEEDDLTESEKQAFKDGGAAVAEKLIQNLQGLQESTCQCPNCHEVSKTLEYLGNAVEAICPKCHNSFKAKEAENLSLALYLLSLNTAQSAEPRDSGDQGTSDE